MELFKKKITEDEKAGLYPLIEIIDYDAKIIAATINNPSSNYSDKIISKLRPRTDILRVIDNLNDREFEALGCYTCKCFSANNIMLTPPGNEGGIDFFAQIDFSNSAHYFFGINGPVRVIGQTKKHSSRIQEKDIKEFNETLGDVYRQTPKINKFIPSWFKSGKGLIVPWFIGHAGFQSGAITRAKNNGMILSDSRMIAEQIAKSKTFQRSTWLGDSVKDIIDSEIQKILLSAS